jgi:hypothetical protein
VEKEREQKIIPFCIMNKLVAHLRLFARCFYSYRETESLLVEDQTKFDRSVMCWLACSSARLRLSRNKWDFGESKKNPRRCTYIEMDTTRARRQWEKPLRKEEEEAL